MIRSVHGDIFKAPAEAITNPVNCAGVMGRGLAAQFKRAHPDNFSLYSAACRSGEVRPGAILITEVLNAPYRYVVNFPTKRHWREKSRLEDIEAGLLTLTDEVRNRGILSLAIPPLGCGLGGLKWGEVRPQIVAAFVTLPDVEVLIYEPA